MFSRLLLLRRSPVEAARLRHRASPAAAAALLPRAFASSARSPPRAATMEAFSAPFGAMPDGAPVTKFTLRNAAGVEVVLASYGATVLSVKVPSRGGGAAEEVTLCHEDSLEKLRANGAYLGATVGRVANRIAGGRFRAGGRDFATVHNNGPNTLHGGVLGFDKRVWSAALFSRGGRAGVTFSLRSHDGEEGFPGAIDVSAEYALGEDSELHMKFVASGATRPTPINLCNHAYWRVRARERASERAKLVRASEHTLRRAWLARAADSHLRRRCTPLSCFTGTCRARCAPRSRTTCSSCARPSTRPWTRRRSPRASRRSRARRLTSRRPRASARA